MVINIAIIFLATAFVILIYHQNALYLKDIPWERRNKITAIISWVTPVVLTITSYLLSRKTDIFFERKWIDLCILYYTIGFIIQLLFFAWGKWKLNKYCEAKEKTLNP